MRKKIQNKRRKKWRSREAEREINKGKRGSQKRKKGKGKGNITGVEIKQECKGRNILDIEETDVEF